VARGATALVTCAADDPDQILGFLVHEGPVVHYLYVKELFRRKGLATALLDSAQIPPVFFYTHRTDDAVLFEGGRFAPEIARRKGKYSAQPAV
jgi:GNAT superfamily N-acetyltransferase